MVATGMTDSAGAAEPAEAPAVDGAVTWAPGLIWREVHMRPLGPSGQRGTTAQRGRVTPRRPATPRPGGARSPA